MADLRVSQSVVEVLAEGAPDLRVSQSVIEVLTRDYVEGGTVPSGTNPPAAALPSNSPQFFGVLEQMDGSGILEAFAESAGGPFADNAGYLGGYKERRILSFGTITRKATTPAGGIQTSTQRVLLDDTDLHMRSQWGLRTLRGRKWSNYVVDHVDRLAEQQPFRLSAGCITDQEPLDDFTFALTVQGMLGRHISRPRNEAMVPPNRLTPIELPILAARHQDGWSPPIGYGFLSDEETAKPQGVVPGEYVATANLQVAFGPGAVNVLVDYYIFFGHAVADTVNLYVTPPGWTPSTPYLVGDRVRPNLTSNGFIYQCIAAGTSGASAPTFSATIGATFGDGSVTWQNVGVDDPDLRYVVPPSAYGQILIDPHKPGWTAATGVTTRYLDFNGYRYHVVCILNSHRFARALREGRMSLTGNFRGIEDVGDGTGTLISAPARIFQHFWSNFVEKSYKTGAWFGVPTFGAYSLFDTTTVADATTVTDTLVSGGPVRSAILFGRQGSQMPLFDAVKQQAASWDLKFAENRHGQITTKIDVPAAPATVTFTDQHDVVRITTSPRRAGYANVVRYRYGPRYAPPVATQLEGEQGQPMPAKPVHEHADWVSGLKRLAHAGAIAQNNGQEEYLDLDLWGVRDAATADMYAARALARAVGPAGVLEGPVGVSITTGLQGLVQDGVGVDIGTMAGVTHVEGLGSGGFVGARVIVDQVDVQPDPITVTLIGDLQA